MANHMKHKRKPVVAWLAGTWGVRTVFANTDFNPQIANSGLKDSAKILQYIGKFGTK